MSRPEIDPDLDVSEDALASMDHGELVALVDRLYARCGEPALAASTARASSDDELRDRICSVRRRVLAKAGGRRPVESAGTASSGADSRRPASAGEATAHRRAFVVLVSDDQALARRARASCGARGVVVVWVASQATLAKLVSSVTPTHVVIDGSAHRIDDASVRDLAARGAQVRWCRGAQATLDALAEIE